MLSNTKQTERREGRLRKALHASLCLWLWLSFGPSSGCLNSPATATFEAFHRILSHFKNRESNLTLVFLILWRKEKRRSPVCSRIRKAGKRTANRFFLTKKGEPHWHYTPFWMWTWFLRIPTKVKHLNLKGHCRKKKGTTLIWLKSTHRRTNGLVRIALSTVELVRSTYPRFTSQIADKVHLLLLSVPGKKRKRASNKSGAGDSSWSP